MISVKKLITKSFLLFSFVFAAVLLVGMTQPKLPTSLQITILDRMGNLVEGAVVSLYDTKENYLNNANPLATEQSDSKGKVAFKKLSPTVYYIDAKKADLNNDGMGAQTDSLSESKVNKVTIIIE